MKIILLFYEATDKYINKSEINNVLDNRKNKKNATAVTIYIRNIFYGALRLISWNNTDKLFIIIWGPTPHQEI